MNLQNTQYKMQIKFFFLLFLLTPFVWSASMESMNNQEKFKYVFQELNKNTMHLIDEFYHPDIEFHDPVGTIKGSANMKRYYENMYKNVKSIRFDFSNFIASEDTIVGVWVMTLVTDKLNGGKPILLDGTSVIKFKEGQAIYHRDYFDMGAFIYENIPLLGAVIKKIRHQFKVD